MNLKRATIVLGMPTRNHQVFYPAVVELAKLGADCSWPDSVLARDGKKLLAGCLTAKTECLKIAAVDRTI